MQMSEVTLGLCEEYDSVCILCIPPLVTDEFLLSMLTSTDATPQVVAGSVYCMGAWQNDLRDSLEISMTGATVIGAMTFMGNVAGFLGGVLFDRIGPKAAVSVGGCALPHRHRGGYECGYESI